MVALSFIIVLDIVKTFEGDWSCDTPSLSTFLKTLTASKVDAWLNKRFASIDRRITGCKEKYSNKKASN